MSNKSSIKISFFMIFILSIANLIYANRFEEKKIVCGTPDIIDYEYPKLNENQKEGRKLFKSLCASCHKIDRKLIGPALERDNWAFEYFYNYIVNEEKLLNSNNIQALKVNKEYLPFKNDHSFNQLSKNDVQLIFDYVNKEYIN